MNEPQKKPQRKAIDLASLMDRIGRQMEEKLARFAEDIREDTHREVQRLEQRLDREQPVETVPLEDWEGPTANIPRQSVTLNDLAVQCFYRNELEEAIGHLEQAVEQDPNLVEAWNNLAMAYSASNRTEKAIKAFSKAIELSPDRTELQNNRGVLAMLSGNPGDALAILEDARERDDQDVTVLLNLAQAYQAMGQDERAVASWRAVREIQPEHPEANRFLRQFYE